MWRGGAGYWLSQEELSMAHWLIVTPCPWWRCSVMIVVHKIHWCLVGSPTQHLFNKIKTHIRALWSWQRTILTLNKTRAGWMFIVETIVGTEIRISSWFRWNPNLLLGFNTHRMMAALTNVKCFGLCCVSVGKCWQANWTVKPQFIFANFYLFQYRNKKLFHNMCRKVTRNLPIGKLCSLSYLLWW